VRQISGFSQCESAVDQKWIADQTYRARTENEGALEREICKLWAKSHIYIVTGTIYLKIHYSKVAIHDAIGP
jgi:hypothetical protein